MASTLGAARPPLAGGKSGVETVDTVDPTTINHIPGSGVRYASLDAIRGIAAVTVILYHTSWANQLSSTNFARNCYTAVDLFFMLSGFVIAASYGKKVGNSTQIVTFLKRRVFRIYPLQWAVMAFLVAIELARFVAQLRGHPAATGHGAFTGPNSLPLLAANFALIQGMGFFADTSWNPPSWSVSAEMLAYLVFAAAGFTGLLRRRPVVLAAAAAGLIAYPLLAFSHDTLDLTADIGIVLCLSAFPMGIVLYQWTAERRSALLDSLTPYAASVWEIVAVAATALVLALAHGAWVVLVVPCFIALIALFQMERGVLSRALRVRPIQWLGAISYSVYLVHVPIRNQIIGALVSLGVPSYHDVKGRLLLDVGPWFGDVVLIGFVLIILVVSALAFRFVEEPARLFGRRTARLAAP